MLQQYIGSLSYRVYLCNPVYLITKKLYSNQIIPTLCRINIQNISMNSETASLQVKVISHVLHLNKGPDNVISVNYHTGS